MISRTSYYRQTCYTCIHIRHLEPERGPPPVVASHSACLLATIQVGRKSSKRGSCSETVSRRDQSHCKMSMDASGSPSLRDKQVASLVSLLNFNQPPAATAGGASTSSSHSHHATNGAGPLAGLSNDASLNAPLPTWKVLILDQRAQDVLATTLRVQDLKYNGVTLHLWVHCSSFRRSAADCSSSISRQLHSDRPPLPDVPAVYFVSPTSENIKRIAEVCYTNLHCPITLLMTLLSSLTGPVQESV